MVMTAQAALWFLIAAVPIGFFVAYSDLAQMKIPNVAVYALVLSYAVLGLIALPFDVYLWQWVHLPVVLIAGIALNAAGALGAGDAKFAAAAAPFVMLGDLHLMVFVFSASLIAGYVTHRIAKYSPLRARVPHWESWTAGKRFPMGFPLAMALVFYLILATVAAG